MPIYMELEGIKGNVTAEGHKEWVEVQSFQFGVGRAIGSPVGNAKDREASAPSISEITVSKVMDPASPYLFTESVIGKGKKCKLHFCRVSSGNLETYAEYELENVLVSGYSVSSGGDRPTEQVSLSFTKVIYKYIPWKEDHAKDSPHPAGYDLAAGKKV